MKDIKNLMDKSDNFFCKNKVGDYNHLCTKPKGHTGRCSKNHLSSFIKKINHKAGNKLALDSYSTPGNKGAAKNRADRCYPVQFTKEQIYEANKRGEHGTCIPLRFASTPEDCFYINVDLAAQIFSIGSGELVLESLNKEEGQLSIFLGEIASEYHPTGVECRICRGKIKFENFDTKHATSDEFSVQLGHITPYLNGKELTAHVAGNTQWIHRDCNIIQGEKTEEETLESIRSILQAHGYTVAKENKRG